MLLRFVKPIGLSQLPTMSVPLLTKTQWSRLVRMQSYQACQPRKSHFPCCQKLEESMLRGEASAITRENRSTQQYLPDGL
jgi:hypothetical protein